MRMIDDQDCAPSTIDLLKQNPGGVALIAGVLAIVTGAFAYTAGYIGPRGLSPARIVDTMEQGAGGQTPDFVTLMPRGSALPQRSLAIRQAGRFLPQRSSMACQCP